jgi:hypothetical protein
MMGLSLATQRRVLWAFVFAVAMGFLETAVVVYIRKLYYPEGFCFPMKLIAPDIVLTEFLREAATIIMLAGIGILAGRNRMERFGYFLFCFAVWDIFYYVFLYALLGWPSSLLTWDVLFFIPTTWVGPVLAPVINSLIMIFLFFVILYFTEKNGKCRSGKWVWILLIGGSLVVIAAYLEDYLHYMLQQFRLAQLFSGSDYNSVMSYATAYIPLSFPWWLFAIGVLAHLLALAAMIKKNRA